MFPVLLCALILLGVAYFLYNKFDVKKSDEYKRIVEELNFVTAQRDTLNGRYTLLKQENEELKNKLKNISANENQF